MSGVPETGIGEESDLGPLTPALASGFLARARSFAGARLSYALADQVVFSFGNMVVAALLSRHCSTWQFGIYILTQRAVDVLLQLCNVFFWAPFVFNLPGTPADRRARYLGSVTAHQLIACVLAAAIMAAASRWAHGPSRGLYYGVFAPLIITTAGLMFREFTRRMYFAEMRFREAFWTDVATVALQVAGVEYLFHRNRLDVPNTLIMLSLGAIAVSLWWVSRERRAIAFSVSAIVSDLRLNLRLGRWFFGSNMVFTVSSQCNPWVLGALLGGSGVADYGICESVVNIPRVALTSLQNVMAPMMARAVAAGGKPALRALVHRLDAAILGGSVVFAVGLVALGPFVARLIFHTFPANGSLILLLLALNLVAFAATLAQTYGLTALNRASFTFYANTIGLAVQVVVSIAFVRHFHVPGAAGAMLLGTSVVAIVRSFFWKRESQLA